MADFHFQAYLKEFNFVLNSQNVRLFFVIEVDFAFHQNKVLHDFRMAGGERRRLIILRLIKFQLLFAFSFSTLGVLFDLTQMLYENSDVARFFVWHLLKGLLLKCRL